MLFHGLEAGPKCPVYKIFMEERWSGVSILGNDCVPAKICWVNQAIGWALFGDEQKSNNGVTLHLCAVNQSVLKMNQEPNLPAVSFRDLFDGDSDLVAEVPPSIHHSISAPSQHHPVSCLIGVILIL